MDLEYTIKTSAELAGAQSAADALERQIGKAKAIKQDYSDLQRQHDLMTESIKLAHVPNEQEIADTAKLEIGKREFLESTRELTRQFPLLGEAFHAVFNPMALAITGIITSVTILIEKFKTAVEVLGGWELPDLTEHASSISAAAEQYDKLKIAAQGADAEFAGAAATFERQKTAIQEQVKAMGALIEAQKQKAIADLDLERAGGNMSGASYNARKALIERGFNAQTEQLQEDARNADLAARQKEAADLQAQSNKETKDANAIQPGLNNADFGELINKGKAAAEEAKKKAAEFRAEEKKARELQDIKDEPAGLQKAKDIAGASLDTLEMEKKYGAVGFDTIAKLNADAAKHAEEVQAAAEQQVRELEAQQAKRKDLQDKGAKDAHDAEAKRLALAGEDDPNKVGSTAWQNAQDRAAAGIRNQASAEHSIAEDESTAKRDIATITELANKKKPTPEDTKRAKEAVADAMEALQDAASTMQELASYGADISKIKQDIAALKRGVAQAKNAVDTH